MAKSDYVLVLKGLDNLSSCDDRCESIVVVSIVFRIMRVANMMPLPYYLLGSKQIWTGCIKFRRNIYESQSCGVLSNLKVTHGEDCYLGDVTLICCWRFTLLREALNYHEVGLLIIYWGLLQTYCRVRKTFEFLGYSNGNAAIAGWREKCKHEVSVSP